MPYSAEISRANPTCFMFLIDQSGSMADDMLTSEGASARTKSQFLADALNTLLQTLVLRCAREEGIRPYFDVGVFGYGNSVGPALSGALAGKELISIADIGNTPARIEDRSKKVEDGAGGLIEQKIKKPVWVDAVAGGGTPMCQALSQATATLRTWAASHPQSFPASVIHITDGESSDGDPTTAMTDLTTVTTSDGACLLYNIHISANHSAREIVFPDDSTLLPDQYAQTLFAGASPLIPNVRAEAQRMNIQTGEGSRAFILNATPITIIQALDIGTKPSTLR